MWRGLVGAFLFVAGGGQVIAQAYFSSPTELRPSAEKEYNAIFAPPPPKQEPHAHAELRGFRRINEPDTVTLEYDRPSYPQWDTNTGILRAGPDGSVKLIDGSLVRLAAVALMYSTGPDEMVRVAFDPVTLEIHEPDYWLARYPNAKRAFRFLSLPPNQLHDPILVLVFDYGQAANKTSMGETVLLDSRTHVRCGKFDYTWAEGDLKARGAIFPRLHDGPLTVVHRCIPQKTHAVELAAKPGETVKLGEFDDEVRLLALESIPGAHAFTMTSSTRREGERVVQRIEYPLSPRHPDVPFTLAMFSHRSGRLPVSFTIEMEAKDGTHYPGLESVSSHFCFDDFPVVPEQIAKFHLGYGISSQLAVFELPRLPGLPKENENITNLFDVTIPYLVTSPGSAISQLKDYTQMSVTLPSAEPKDYSYITLRNIKVANLLEYFLDCYGYPSAEIDPKRFNIKGK